MNILSLYRAYSFKFKLNPTLCCHLRFSFLASYPLLGFYLSYELLNNVHSLYRRCDEFCHVGKHFSVWKINDVVNREAAGYTCVFWTLVQFHEQQCQNFAGICIITNDRNTMFQFPERLILLYHPRLSISKTDMSRLQRHHDDAHFVRYMLTYIQTWRSLQSKHVHNVCGGVTASHPEVWCVFEDR